MDLKIDVSALEKLVRSSFEDDYDDYDVYDSYRHGPHPGRVRDSLNARLAEAERRHQLSQPYRVRMVDHFGGRCVLFQATDKNRPHFRVYVNTDDGDNEKSAKSLHDVITGEQVVGILREFANDLSPSGAFEWDEKIVRKVHDDYLFRYRGVGLEKIGDGKYRILTAGQAVDFSLRLGCGRGDEAGDKVREAMQLVKNGMRGEVTAPAMKGAGKDGRPISWRVALMKGNFSPVQVGEFLKYVREVKPVGGGDEEPKEVCPDCKWALYHKKCYHKLPSGAMGHHCPYIVDFACSRCRRTWKTPRGLWSKDEARWIEHYCSGCVNRYGEKKIPGVAISWDLLNPDSAERMQAERDLRNFEIDQRRALQEERDAERAEKSAAKKTGSERPQGEGPAPAPNPSGKHPKNNITTGSDSKKAASSKEDPSNTGAPSAPDAGGPGNSKVLWRPKHTNSTTTAGSNSAPRPGAPSAPDAGGPGNSKVLWRPKHTNSTTTAGSNSAPRPDRGTGEHEVVWLSLNAIGWSQADISGNFTHGGCLTDLVQLLKDRGADALDQKISVVSAENKLFSADNRRLYCLKKAFCSKERSHAGGRVSFDCGAKMIEVVHFASVEAYGSARFFAKYTTTDCGASIKIDWDAGGTGGVPSGRRRVGQEDFGSAPEYSESEGAGDSCDEAQTAGAGTAASSQGPRRTEQQNLVDPASTSSTTASSGNADIVPQQPVAGKIVTPATGAPSTSQTPSTAAELATTTTRRAEHRADLCEGCIRWGDCAGYFLDPLVLTLAMQLLGLDQEPAGGGVSPEEEEDGGGASVGFGVAGAGGVRVEIFCSEARSSSGKGKVQGKGKGGKAGKGEQGGGAKGGGKRGEGEGRRRRH